MRRSLGGWLVRSLPMTFAVGEIKKCADNETSGQSKSHAQQSKCGRKYPLAVRREGGGGGNDGRKKKNTRAAAK
ncbi:uncharacterized protein F4812DRAFT_429250 [Daldinia caldariorum]|uniref:uncharacterized protein n=1 Tax=Daldinia caldariorum TaxID=326644 RepID=UPI00200868AB|nr:uncharacterized protein F4812DRAFT_429250 [Daldinia caldariorum]KAI1467367.1 hypothetical protein F4812DRAFT_429250 [Daldinia caldariorum]